jgi:hypothetical protein
MQRSELKAFLRARRAALAPEAVGLPRGQRRLTPGLRREAEPRLLALLPTLQALGVFELFAIRDPALAAMVRDELPEDRR